MKRFIFLVGLISLLIFLSFKIDRVKRPVVVDDIAVTPTITTQPTLTVTPTYKPVEKVIIAPTNPPTPSNFGSTIPEGELISAINNYRQANGLSRLNTNESLCQETRKRVQDMVNLNVGRKPEDMILNHDGMAADVQNRVLNKMTGKTYFGENVAFAFCKRPSDGVVVDITTGTQLVEWCFDSSPTHRANLLKPDYTDVCSSGQFPFYVETFAK